MDEMHYLADRFRGAVWEEVILQLPEHVALVGLSATVSNAEEFGAWLVDVRGDTTVVVDEHRPVPLWQHMMVGRPAARPVRSEATAEVARRTSLAGVDPELVRATRELDRQAADRGLATGRGRTRRRGAVPAGRLPAAVADHRDRPAGRRRAAAGDHLHLLPGRLRRRRRPVRAFRAAADHRGRGRPRSARSSSAAPATCPQADLGVLGYWEWREALERGIAAHHAGMLPAFKETVEELFVRGLVRAVFATETLALGINMPARTVVLERLVKFNGEAHADLTPGEYTQLTGRAGRRGIDVEGHAVVVWQPGMDPEQVAGLASTRTYPLRSSFRPGYNMAVNLVDRLGVAAARELLEQSFAPVPGRPVGGRAGPADRPQHRGPRRATRDSMRCHLGDFAEYVALRRTARRARRRSCAPGGRPSSATPRRTRCAALRPR